MVTAAAAACVYQAPFHRTSTAPIAGQSRRVQSLAFDSLLIHCTVNGPAGVLQNAFLHGAVLVRSVRHALIIQRRKATDRGGPSTLE